MDEEKEIKVLNFEPFEGDVVRLIDGKVHYKVHRKGRRGKATLYWSESEGRWLADVSGDFLEGYEHGRELYLPFSDESLRLNQSAYQKLLEAYGIKPEKIDLSQVDRLSPSELEKIAAANK